MRQHRGAISVGLIAVLLGCAALAGGLLDSLFWLGFDLHCRYCSTIPADPGIALIDIDDQSLAAFRDWPWPRRRYAELIQTLDNLGARSIVLDLIFAEPATPRCQDPSLAPGDASDSELSVLGDPAYSPVIWDDQELANAMRASRGVYLPMYAGLSPSGAEETFSSEERLAHALLAENPATTFRHFFEMAQPDEDFDKLTPQRARLRRIFLSAQNEHAAFTSAVPCIPLAPTAVEPVFPIAKLGRAAKGIGLASFDRGKGGGVLRVLPPAAHCRGQCYLQLGLLAAMDRSGRGREISAAGNAVHIGGEEVHLTSPSMRLPSLPTVELPILWHVPDSRRWEDSFLHLPAGKVLEIAALREAIRENDLRVRLRMHELVKLRHADTKAQYLDYLRLLQARGDFGDSRIRPPDGRNLDGEIAAIEAEALQWLARAYQLWQSETPRDPREQKEKQLVQGLHADLLGAHLAARMQTLNQSLERQIDELQSFLRPWIEGKLCLIGYTASAAADLVTTPVYSAMPGVMAHANMANMVLQQRFLKVASPWVSLSLLFVSGVVAALLSTIRGWKLGLLGCVAVSALLALAGALLFARIDYHIATLPAVAQVAMTWAAVTAYRQGFEERTRRRLFLALAQYTSPQIARRIAQTSRSKDLAPQSATVTCFFCDLAGFTRLSEQLGPLKTQEVLNPYLETVSSILIQHGAMVNKFMGDGVFAFFNSPLLPCPNHAQAACAAALQIARKYPMPKRGNQSRLPHLSVRIGIATGEAFVGDYGSATKLDYTCIGDTANLAARLEELNKTLGTVILVDESTRQTANGNFRFRSLDEVEITGRTKRETVHELLERLDSQP